MKVHKTRSKRLLSEEEIMKILDDERKKEASIQKKMLKLEKKKKCKEVRPKIKLAIKHEKDAIADTSFVAKLNNIRKRSKMSTKQNIKSVRSNNGLVAPAKGPTLLHPNAKDELWLQEMLKKATDGYFSEDSEINRTILTYLNHPTLSEIEIRQLKTRMELFQLKVSNSGVLNESGVHTINESVDALDVLNHNLDAISKPSSEVCTSGEIDTEAILNLQNSPDRRGGWISAGVHLASPASSSAGDMRAISSRVDITAEVPTTSLPNIEDDNTNSMLESKKCNGPEYFSKEEMEAFSRGVHLWMKAEPDGGKYLKDVRLGNRQFTQIYRRVGPNSTLKIIKPGRSILTYKAMWRNSNKSRDFQNGHKDTGYETKSGVHSSEPPFCPFNHCSTLVTPYKYKNCEEVSTPISNRTNENEGSSIKKVMKITPTLKVKKVKKILFGDVHDRITLKIQCKFCGNVFKTADSLAKHLKTHKKTKKDNNPSVCEVCYKQVYNLDKHMRAMHKERVDRYCETCESDVPFNENMIHHKRACKLCPMCGTFFNRKDRRLFHMKWQCERRTHPSKSGEEPHVSEFNVNPSSLMGDEGNKASNNSSKKVCMDDIETESTSLVVSDKVKRLRKNQPIDASLSHGQNMEVNHRPILSTPSHEDCDPNFPRKRFPFDDEGTLYESEHEEEDDEKFTRQRRKSKDKLELRLREVDENPNFKTYRDGHCRFMKDFKFFQLSERGQENAPDDVFTINMRPKTCEIYARFLDRDLLQAFKKHYDPFYCTWLLDCVSAKECMFDGQERSSNMVSITDPIYLTVTVLQTALEKYKSSDMGNQRSFLLSAATQFMRFVENWFYSKLPIYGLEPYNKVKSYHEGVKAFIDQMWKTCNSDKKKSIKDNKVLKEIKNPNYEAQILNKYREYVLSDSRLEDIQFVLKLSQNEQHNITNSEFARAIKICVAECTLHTGRRPNCFLRMPFGDWVKKEFGFPPHEKSNKDECTREEQTEEGDIWARTNPSLPPSHLACKHQLESKSPTCQFHCPDECEPSGYNVLCYWDKVRDDSKASYIHFPMHLKRLLDHYDRCKSRFFKNRNPHPELGDNWLELESTSFFLNSKGMPLKSVNMSHLSNAMEIDVSALTFRRIVSSWGIAHRRKEIRDAEPRALNHSRDMADNVYKVNQQLSTQNFVQEYIKADHLACDKVISEIEKSEIEIRDSNREKEARRILKQQEDLIEKEYMRKEDLKNKQSLGPRQRIDRTDGAYFSDLMKKAFGKVINKNMERFGRWRKYVVRCICAADGEVGMKLQDLWVSFYRGDLVYGISNMRDEELRVGTTETVQYLLERDRNTWISHVLYNSYLSVNKAKERVQKKKNR